MAAVVEAFTRRPHTRTEDMGIDISSTDSATIPLTQGVPAPITTTSVQVFTTSETTTIVNPASTITVISVVPSGPSPQLVPNDAANSPPDSTTAFFKNTAAVAATFTVVGLAILAILGFCLIRSVRRHRRRLDETQGQIEAARSARVLGDTDSEDAHRIAERRSVAGLVALGEKKESRLRFSTMGLTPLEMGGRGSTEKASFDEYYDASGARRTSMAGKRSSSSPTVAQREAMMLNARSYSVGADLAVRGSGANTLHHLPPEMMALAGIETVPNYRSSSTYAAPALVRGSSSFDAPRTSSSGTRPSADSDLPPHGGRFEPRRPSADYLERAFGYAKPKQHSQGGFSDQSSDAGQLPSSNRRPSLDQISNSSSSYLGHVSKRSSTDRLRNWTEGLMKERMLVQQDGSGKGKGKQREMEVDQRSVQAKVQHKPHLSLPVTSVMMEPSAIPLSATTNSNPSTPISQRIASPNPISPGSIVRMPSPNVHARQHSSPLASYVPPSPYARSSSRGSVTMSPSPSQAQIQIRSASPFNPGSPQSRVRALSPPPVSSRSSSNVPMIPIRSSRRPSTAPSLLSFGESESKFRPSEKHVQRSRQGSIGTADTGESAEKHSAASETHQQRSFIVMRKRPSTAPQATSPRMSIFGELAPLTALAAAILPQPEDTPKSPGKFRITNLADDDELDSSSTGHGHDNSDRPSIVDESRPVTSNSRKESISSSIPTLSRASTFSRPSLGSRPSTSGTGVDGDDEDEDVYSTFGRAPGSSPIPPLEINHAGPSRRQHSKAKPSSFRPSTAPSPSIPTLVTPTPNQRRPSTSTATSSGSGSTVRPSLTLDAVGSIGQNDLFSRASTSTVSTPFSITPSPSPRPSPGLSNATSAPTPTTATTAHPHETLPYKRAVEEDYFSSRRTSVSVADPSVIVEPYSGAPDVALSLQSISEADAQWLNTPEPVEMEMQFKHSTIGSASPSTSPYVKRSGGMRSGGRNSNGSQHGRSSSGSQEGGGVGMAVGSRASVDTTLSSLRDDHDYTPGHAGLKIANA